MDRPRSRQSWLGRWAPMALYALIVLGWLGEGVSSGAQDRLWLVVWALPVPAIYLWRTRRSPP
jgi:hypothetical protein